MTKVEELRERLQEMLKGKEEEPHEHSDAWAFVAKLFVLLEDKWQGPLPDVVTMHIYAIQSASHAEGVQRGFLNAKRKGLRVCK